MNKTLFIVAAALVIGYLVGNSGSKSTTISSYPPVYVPSYPTSSDREDELREKIENARRNLEAAQSNAQDLGDKATMRWLETGSFHDMTRMTAAEDATRSIQEALNDLDD